MKGALMRILRLSWDQVEKACRIVSNRILESDFRPDLCVAVSRGGFIPARLLCDLLDMRNLACLRIEYYSGMNVTLNEPRISCPVSANAKEKKVLIVDDVADSGSTLILAKKHLQEAGADKIQIATLHYKPWSKLRPDYYAYELKSWIVYPWEVFETIRNMFSELLQRGKKTDEARRQLQKTYFSGNEVLTALRIKTTSRSPSGRRQP
jgi:hypoxanthine phosphoribosyltransferase